MDDLHDAAIFVKQGNFIAAVQNYQKVIDTHPGFLYLTTARSCLDKLLCRNDISAADLNRIGMMYHTGDGIGLNYGSAFKWYQKAKERGNAFAFRNLGLLYADGSGVSKDIVAAARYYQQAIEKGYPQAQQDLDQLFDSNITGEELNSIGVVYYIGEGVQCNYSKAGKWYEKAKEKEYAAGYRNFGLLYECGLSVPKNIIVAAKHYQQAIEKGYPQAQQDLDRLCSSVHITDDDLNSIAVMYHTGDGVKSNHSKALLWYKKAQEKGNAMAYRNVGLLYEEGIVIRIGTTGTLNNRLLKNTQAAAKYYQQAVEKGYAQAQNDLDRLFVNATSTDWIAIGSMYHEGKDVTKDFAKAKKWYEGYNKSNMFLAKKHLKNLERDWLIDQSKKSFYFLNERDHENNTALHRTARYLHLKNCARLLFLGADKEIYNAELKKPFFYLSSTDQQKVTKLHNLLSGLINNLEAKTPDVILGRMFVDNGSFNKTRSLQTLTSLYQLDEIRPLMDLSKLAMLALHNLSNRKKFSDVNYDSDNDDEDSIKEDQRFTIRIDANESTVQNIYHYGKDGQEGKSACGLYGPQGNTIYVGGNKNATEARATLIHEMTHFVTDEVFLNLRKPYAINDSKNQILFEAIVNDLEKRQYMLDDILKEVFRLYERSKYHSEFIVRVPQMIVQYPDGIDRLKTQAPALLNYYRKVFLVAVQNHINELQKRALGYWPLELFKRNRQRNYSFQISSEYMDTSPYPIDMEKGPMDVLTY